MTRSLTSAERVLHALRELILDGDLAAGARLGEVELAEPGTRREVPAQDQLADGRDRPTRRCLRAQHCVQSRASE